MSERENVVFDLEQQIEWIHNHPFPGRISVADAIKRAIYMLLEDGAWHVRLVD